jgi:hypothetical protein
MFLSCFESVQNLDDQSQAIMTIFVVKKYVLTRVEELPKELRYYDQI